MLPVADVDNFGAVDADSDVLLSDCFQDHPAYLDVLEGRRSLVLGRKGSGKTAIYKRLLEQETSEHLALGNSFEDYPWAHHDLQAQGGVPQERRYLHSWRYLILMGAAKLLLNRDASQPWSDESMLASGQLEAFVVDSYGSTNPEFRQLFMPSYTLQLSGGLDLKVLSLKAEQVRVADLPVHVQDVNKVVQTLVIDSLNPAKKYYICFDQLDLGFSKTDESYEHRLVGLILAARDIATAARRAGKFLNVVVFLRDDIYQDLQFEDKNKVTEGLATWVRWSEAGGQLTLKSLMERRFGRVLSEGDRGVHVPWERVFDATKEMPSRQTKYRHICDRTLLRPRDIIKFCNEVLNSHKRALEAGKLSSDLLTNASVHDARDAYSQYLLNELDDEIAKHVPDYRDYLEVLKVVGSLNFSKYEFQEAWLARGGDSGEAYVEALAQLFEFSVIGYLKPGGRGGGSEYVWRYLDARARFNRGADVYKVHPGFKESLDLTRNAAQVWVPAESEIAF